MPVNFHRSTPFRSDDRSYEYTSGHTSQGLYVKHLLRHIGDNDCFDSVLNKVGESFVKEEDHSIVKRMLPVFRFGDDYLLTINYIITPFIIVPCARKKLQYFYIAFLVQFTRLFYCLCHGHAGK